MDLKAQTVETYNKSAQRLANKFDSQGARKEDINFVFSHYTKENPFVLEIGCGNGRDAEEILKHTTQYIGIDISEKLLAIARAKNNQTNFTEADVETYSFPSSIDIVFAFASLIHVDKEKCAAILEKIHNALLPNGLVFISLKHSDLYTQVTKDDEFGTRTYWHYSEQNIKDIAPQFLFEKVNIHDLRGQMWMEILLRKK